MQLPFSADLREANPQLLSSFAPGSTHFWLAYRAGLREKRAYAAMRRINALSMERHDCLANLFTSLCNSLSFSLCPILLHVLCDDLTFIGKMPEKDHCTASQTFCYLSNPKRLFPPIEHLLNVCPAEFLIDWLVERSRRAGSMRC